MLWKASALKGYKIQASDGEIGVINDLLFDDKTWTARWLVVDTGFWLFGRKVLLPVSALGKPDDASGHLTVRLTRQQVKDSPSVDTHLPVSRQLEAHVYNHYGWIPYWYAGLAPMGAGTIANDGGPDLRSVAAVTLYPIEATDGEIGHAEAFLFDPGNWQIRYIVVDTKNELRGKKVVIAPRLIRDIDWLGSRIHLNVDIGKVKASPAYDPAMIEEGEFNHRFHEHFWPSEQESDDTLKLDA